MQTAVRPYVTAGLAIAVSAGLIAAPAIAADRDARAVTDEIVTRAVRLTASSITNIPVNLVEDVLNIPQNYVNGIDYTGRALLFTGSWWVSNQSNIWGTDTADPPKYKGLANTLIPFPAFSEPFGDLVAAVAAAEIPVHPSCGPVTCPPIAPFDAEGIARVLLGLDSFPIIEHFFTQRLGPTYTFGDVESYPGPVPDAFGFQGTKTAIDPETGETIYLMPWSGTTANLDPSVPFVSYINHLMDDPQGVTFPTSLEVRRAFSTLLAGIVVDFNPFTPNMSYCWSCQWPAESTPEGILKVMQRIDPGNENINAWLADHSWQNTHGRPAGAWDVGQPWPSVTPDALAPGGDTRDGGALAQVTSFLRDLQPRKNSTVVQEIGGVQKAPVTPETPATPQVAAEETERAVVRPVTDLVKTVSTLGGVLRSPSAEAEPQPEETGTQTGGAVATATRTAVKADKAGEDGAAVGGKKIEPRKATANGTSGRKADGLKSLGDRITSRVSKIADKLGNGGKKADKTDGTGKTDKSGTAGKADRDGDD